MGQAKMRRDEINLLKSVTKEVSSAMGEFVKLIAVKYHRNGTISVMNVNMDVKRNLLNKDSLLKMICTKKWGSKEQAQNVIDYFSMTNTFDIYKMVGAYGAAINFYESDPVRNDAYSCRQIICIKSEDSFFNLLTEYANEAESLSDDCVTGFVTC